MRMLVILVRKILREQRFVLLFCGAMLSVLFCGVSYLFVTFGDTTMETLGRLPPQLVAGLFGGVFGGLQPIDIWLMTLLVHPLMLTLFSVAMIAIALKSLVGEIDRGTIDILLSCPLARWQLVLATSLVLVGVLVGLLVVVWWSMRLGLWLAEVPTPASLPAFRWVIVNLGCVFLSVAAVSLLIASTTSDQGRALGRSLAFVVLSFFINLLAGLWQKIAWIDVVSIFHYYQPRPIIAGGGPRPSDLAVLLGVAAIAWTVAIVHFERRDIATV